MTRMLTIALAAAVTLSPLALVAPASAQTRVITKTTTVRHVRHAPPHRVCRVETHRFHKHGRLVVKKERVCHMVR